MENKLEQLLNSLVKVGWKPYGIPRVKNVVALNHYISFSKRTILGIEFFEYTLRSLVSKESGLWEFVCLKRLWKDIDEEKYWHKKTPKMSELRSYDYHFKEYRIIESSLKDESELEQFLLDNIKVDN